ncbi:MAG: SRPBCC domain-containing protein [Ignavibacteriales bacterium]|nr:SRPBCC domain-containing protein [Ignavibacteriales bacterium]
MKEIHTEIEINSSAENVWNILTDFEGYEKWNPLITNAEGEAIKGAKLKIEVTMNGKPMKFSPKVLVAEKNIELRWIGKVVSKKFFAGEHIFIIAPLGKNKILFIHGEKFSGVLLKTQKNMLDGVEKGFEEMNVALKRRAEAFDTLKYWIKK